MRSAERDPRRRRWTVVVVDEEHRLDARLHELIELLADTLPARAEHLASRRASVDAAAGRGE
jgi:hypothetical protein